MDSDILTLALHWLPASDAFSSSCVCRAWRDVVSSDESGLWKQVCQNTHPVATNEAAKQNGTDFHRLAKSLGRTIVENPPPAPQFSPTLRLGDLFATVDLYRKSRVDGKQRRVPVASWSCPVEWNTDGSPELTLDLNAEQKMVLQGANPYWPELANQREYNEVLQEWRNTDIESLVLPLVFAACDVLGATWYKCDAAHDNLRVKVMLFRRDNMKSVCIMDESTYGAVSHASICMSMMKMVGACYRSVRSLHLASDEAGRTAQLMMHYRGFTGMRVKGRVNFKTILPCPGAEEPLWLANMRQAYVGGNDHWHFPNQDDRRALSSIANFEFEAQDFSFWFDMTTKGDEDGSFSYTLCQDDIMVALEGLCWE